MRTVWCVGIGVAAHLALWQISEPRMLFSDFYKAYFPAGKILWENGPGASFPLKGTGGFVNLPIVGWLFVPLVPLGKEPAGWAFLALGAAATIAALLVLRKIAYPRAHSGAPLLLLFLLNGPLINSLREGNTTHFVLLLLILAFVCLRRGADFAAGMLLGLCALVKLPFLLYAAYFALRRRWMVIAGGTGTLCAAVLLSVALSGLDNNLIWFHYCIKPFLGGIIPAFNVQSVDSFAVRLITGTSRLTDWSPMSPPGIYGLIRLFIFAIILGSALCIAKRPGGHEAIHIAPKREALEFSLILTLALVLSPISWSHYYLLLLLPGGLFLGDRLKLFPDILTRRLAWSAIVLGSLPVVMLPLQADAIGETLARTLVSAHFFGGLAWLAALLRSLYLLESLPSRDAPPLDRMRTC